MLARYRQFLLGLGWSFINPLLMLAITFVFRTVFKALEGGNLAISIRARVFGLIVFRCSPRY